MLDAAILSKDEWETLVFNASDNNIFGFSGMGPHPSRCQGNASSIFNQISLALSIGVIQGGWHIDQGNDPTCPTLMIMFLQLPKGT